MSVITKKRQTEIYEGLGAPEPETGSIPVLFGTRFIEKPRIIYARTTDMPGRELPAVSREPSLKGDPDLGAIRQFAFTSVLCHGELDECFSVWCNGIRLNSRNESLLLGSGGEFNKFADNNFFGDNEPLSGYCFVTRGESEQLSQLYDGAEYLKEWRAELRRLKRDENTQNYITPPDGVIAYNGVALAHVYVFEQSSDTFNNWSFLCGRFPQSNWLPDWHKIKLLTDRFEVEFGGETRERHHILAIDCSPINGLPIELIEKQRPLNETFTREFLERHHRFSPTVGRFGGRTTTGWTLHRYTTKPGESSGGAVTSNDPAQVSWGIFKYRYDIIREGAVKALQNFKAELDKASTRVDYKWSLRVMLYRGEFLNTSQVSTDVRELSIPSFNDASGSPSPYVGKTLFESETNFQVTNANYITAMIEAIRDHPWLQSSPPVSDVEAGNRPIGAWRRTYNTTLNRSSYFFQAAPSNDWDKLWVDPKGWAPDRDRQGLPRWYREYDTNDPQDALAREIWKQSQRICWSPINESYHPHSAALRRAWPVNTTRGSRDYGLWGWLLYLLKLFIATPTGSEDGRALDFTQAIVGLSTSRFNFNRQLQWVQWATGSRILQALGLAGKRVTGGIYRQVRSAGSGHNRWGWFESLRYCRADLYKVFEAAFSKPEFANTNINKLPQLNIISGPNWPGRLGHFDVLVTAGRWFRQGDVALVGQFLHSVAPTISDLYHIGRYDDIKPDNLTLSDHDKIRWSFTQPPSTTRFSDRLRSLIATRYSRPSKPFNGPSGTGINSRLYYETGDRKVNWDYMILDPFCWGSTSRYNYKDNSFSPSSSYGTDKRTHNGWNLDENYNDMIDHLSILQLNNQNPIEDDNPDHRPYEAWGRDGGSEAGQSAVWPSGSEPGSFGIANIRWTRRAMEAFTRNTTASIDSDPETAIGSLGKRMGAIRTKVVKKTQTHDVYGANPAHIIRDCLLNDKWGGGRRRVVQAANIDEASFSTAAEILFEEEMGLCFYWDRKTTVTDFIADVLRHIDGILYERAGKFYLVLMGARDQDNELGHYRTPIGMSLIDYQSALTHQLGPDNISSVTNLKAPRDAELFNRVVIEYTPYGSVQTDSAPFSNERLIDLYGLNVKTVEYKGIMDFKTVRKIGLRDISIEESGLIACDVNVLPEIAVDILPGSVVAMNWVKLQIENVFMRVLSVSRGGTKENMYRLSLLQTHKGVLEQRT